MINASKTKFQTPFAAFVEARRLESFVDDPNLLPAFASSNIKILPYQIAAARFALRSGYLKGCILCDEGSLGKTYEALLIIAQKWYEGKEKILVVLPKNLINQWKDKIEADFSLPVALWQKDKQEKAVVLISYDEAVKNATALEETTWNLVVFDEADFLFKPENKSVIALKNMAGDAFKLLLTPTPITLSIMDIYGLIHFIDETLLPDSEEFYKRYFRKPENYGELSGWVSQFAFRTLKKQVSQYANFTNRIPLTVNYALNTDEKKLYGLVEKYLKLPQKTAYPDMDLYRLSLMFYHTLSSSPLAFANMLKAPIERASGEEQALLQEMQTLAGAIQINGKMAELLKTLKPVFAHLKQQKENQKAIIFVDNLTTLDVLCAVLQEKYIITKSLDEFRNDKNTQILITNDELAKGLDIEFCPVVVNYDLLYNAVEMEQRICRCHRQGQQSDVLVINMLSPENFSDVRILELINKRMLQFSGIFGVSDNIVGNFETSLDEILQKRRALDEIQADFSENLATHQAENEETLANAEDVLFTTFTKKVADNVIVSPNYIEEKTEAINRDLWEVVKYYFEKNRTEYTIDEETQTLTLLDDKEPPHLFYYWTGSRNKPYTGQRKYGASKDFKPSHNRITPASVIARGAIEEVKCPSQGTISVNADIEPCEITFFAVDIRCKTTRYTTYLNDGTTLLKFYNALTGITKNGRILTEKECLDILQMSVIEWSGNDTECRGNSSYLLSDKQTFYPNDPLGDNLIKKYSEEKSQTVQGDIDLIQLKATRQKTILEQSLAELRQQVKKIKEAALGTANDRLAELQNQKQINALEKELKDKEQSLFLGQMKIDVEAEKEINTLTSKDELFARPYTIFKLQVKGRKE